MKAILYTNYGSPNVLQLKEVEKPIPKENEVLVKVNATTVTTVDSIFRKGNQFFARLATGIGKPKKQVLGTEFSGTVEAVGKKVKLFKEGDQVYGANDTKYGTHAEYINIPDDHAFIEKPSNLTFEEAAAVPSGALTALPFLRDAGKIRSGQKIVVIGASGSVGSYAVQFAKYFGAEVTGVCSSANVDLVKSLGADKVIDYTKEDFTRSGESYDIIFDTIGKSSFSICKNSLKESGMYLTTFIGFAILFQMLLTSKFTKKKAVIIFTGLRSAADKIKDLRLINELIEEEKLKPVIDKKYTLEQTPDAHRYVDTGHKKGNVVINLDNESAEQ